MSVVRGRGIFICIGAGLLAGTKPGHSMFTREIYIGVAPVLEDSAWKNPGFFGMLNGKIEKIWVEDELKNWMLKCWKGKIWPKVIQNGDSWGIMVGDEGESCKRKAPRLFPRGHGSDRSVWQWWQKASLLVVTGARATSMGNHPLLR